MTKQEFDHWFSLNYDKLVGDLTLRYPRCKDSITEDLNGFYLNVLDRALEHIIDINSYVYTYIYNTHYKYTKNLEGYIVNGKKLSIKLVETLPDDLVYEQTEEESESREIILTKLDKILNEMSLDQRKLYNLYFIQGQVSRQIALLLGCSHSSVAKSVKTLKLYIANKLETGSCGRVV